MSELSKADLCNRIGVRLARRLFELRGNHSEMHVTESELAGMLQAAAHLGIVGVTVPMGEVNRDERAFLETPSLLKVEYDQSVTDSIRAKCAR